MSLSCDLSPPCHGIVVLFGVTLIKLLAEIALLSLLGRWVLRAWLSRLSPHAGRGNPVLWLLDALCLPFDHLGRWFSPRIVLAQHHALVAFLLLMLAWVVATVVKISICVNIGVVACR